MTEATTTTEALDTFAGILWTPDDLIEIRPLPPDKGRRCWVKAGELRQHVERLEAENENGANIYAGVIPRRHDGAGTDAETDGGFVGWADFDHVDPREAWRRIKAAGIAEPSLVVNSGHGAHAYWRFAERQDPAELAELVADIAAAVGSDPVVANPSRIMRLPGFTNHKEPAAPCGIVHATGKVFDFWQFRQTVPSKPSDAPPRPSGHAPGDDAPSAPGEAMLRRAAAYLERVEGISEGGRNQSAFRVAAILINDFGLSDAQAWPLLCEWNAKNTPPLGEKELRAVLNSGGRYAKEPAGAKAARPPDRPAPQRREPERSAHVIPATPKAGGLDELRQELEAQTRGDRRAIPLPWSRLSSLSGGLRRGTVCFLAGPSGTGKSFLTATIARHVSEQGESWRFLPLEDRRIDFQWRLLALLAGDYRMIDEDPDTADLRREALDAFGDQVAELAANVCENPRIGQRDDDGRAIVPPLPYQVVLDWIRRAVETSRVVFVDPFSQIEFDGREKWKAEEDFIRQCLAITADSGATVCMVAHTVKRPGRSASLPLTLEDVQGSAMIGRLAHIVILLDAHDDREAEVYRAGGLTEAVDHNRTVMVAKTRNGKGPRQRIAFNQDSEAPIFHELGVIAGRSGARRQTTRQAKGGQDWANDF